MFQLSELSSLNSLLLDKIEGYTLCEHAARGIYKYVKKIYPGTFEDLAQSAVVGLLEWGNMQPDQEHLNVGSAKKVVDKALREEVKRNRAFELRGDGDCDWGLDGEDRAYFDPEDTRDLITSERARALDKAIGSIEKIVGSDGTLVLRLKLVFNLSYAAIQKRFRVSREENKTMGSSHNTYLLGYPNTSRAYTLEQLEQLYLESLEAVRKAQAEGRMKGVDLCLKFDQVEAEIRRTSQEQMRAYKEKHKGEK